MFRQLVGRAECTVLMSVEPATIELNGLANGLADHFLLHFAELSVGIVAGQFGIWARVHLKDR